MDNDIFSLRQIKRLRILYGVALSFIALTLMTSSFVMHYSIQRNSGDARVINLSGRQRMLSQRIVKCALALALLEKVHTNEPLLKELEDSLRDWKKAHIGLQYGDESLGLPRRQQSVEILELFCQADVYYQRMVNAATSLVTDIRGPAGSETSSIVLNRNAAAPLLAGEKAFLPLMDRITFVFDKESRERTGQLQTIEFGVLALGLGILLFEYLVIFRPSVRQLVTTVQALLDSQQELRSQLIRAAKYVQALLPSPIQPGDLRVDWRYIPTAELGGDMLGYHWIDQEHFAMYLIDVSDHGVGPALLSVSVTNTLRTQMLPATDFCQPSQVIRALNQLYQSEHHDDLYFTLWYGVYNRSTKEILFASAGHPAAILVEKSGQLKNLSVPGSPVGLFPEILTDEGRIKLETPAQLLIFSDGCFEVKKPDGSMWTAKDFLEFLSVAHQENISELDGIINRLKKTHNRDTFSDDFTLVKIWFP